MSLVSICEISQDCLICPLPACVLDNPVGRTYEEREQRDKKIAEFLAVSQVKVTQISLAIKFEVSLRTVKRSLERLGVTTIRSKTGSTKKQRGSTYRCCVGNQVRGTNCYGTGSLCRFL